MASRLAFTLSSVFCFLTLTSASSLACCRSELSDKSLSTEEQQRLKLAFAEGYLSGGNKQTNTGWGGRVFQGLYNALRIAAIVLLIYVVFGE